MSDKTILYVEDNEFNLKMVRQLLARTAYRLIEATDGEMGVATALKEVPDLILMDIHLPKMSGLDATRRLRGGHADLAVEHHALVGCPGNATRIDVMISYRAPLGVIGEKVGRLLTPVFKEKIESDLNSYKHYIENASLAGN